MNILRIFAAPLFCLSFSACSQDQTTQPVVDVDIPLTRFTFHQAIERDATWSPDGQWIAFGSKRSGNEDIWVKPVGGGEARQLTSNPADEVYASWSPDGTRVAFTSRRGAGGNVWTIPAGGGEATQITTGADADSVSLEWDGGSLTSWSPDSEWIAFTSLRGGSTNIWMVPSTGGEARQFTHLGGDLPNWSPDGEWLAYNSNSSGNTDIWIIPTQEGGEARQLTKHASTDAVPNWSPDGRWLVFQSGRSGTSFDIWIIAAEGGTPIQITDIEESFEVVPRWSPDGRKISFNGGPRTNVLEFWSVPTTGGEATYHSDKKLDTIQYGLIAPDQQKVALVKSGEDGNDIWLEGEDGDAIWLESVGDSAGVQLTEGGMVSERDLRLSWSNDGRHIAFSSDRGGNTNIWRAPVAGGRPRQITVTSGADITPTWSPDGKKIAFMSDTNGNWDIWMVPALGGKAEPFISSPEPEGRPVWSPDGEHLAFLSTYEQSEVANIWIAPVAGGEPTRLTEGFDPSWSPDGRNILFTHAENIWIAPLAGGAPRPLLDYPDRIYCPSWSPDGSQVYFLRRGGNTDIWIADLSNLEVLK